MLWKKTTDVKDWVTRFTVGDDYIWDTYLLPYDVRGTLGHAQGLVTIGILTEDELAQVSAHLENLVQAHARGEVTVRPEDEDCHTVIEQYLTAQLGSIGKKIHTGRSRNDQVLTALRLFVKDQLLAQAQQVLALIDQLCRLGEGYASALMPGYTHFQRAMPTTAGLWAHSYAELLAGDLETLRFAYTQIDTSPLGSAAGYGVPYLPLPRETVAHTLGFSQVQQHVPVVQLSRGKLELQAVHAQVQIGASINRLASDLILFNTTEYGFVHLPAEYCTGSSIMPQKQNPDVLELARASYHRLLAEMNVLLTLPSNLPSGYHRDLQLTKEAIMRSTFLMNDVLTAMNKVLPGVRFVPEAMRAALSPDLFATARALELVKAGVPFREAYQQAAASLADLTVPEDAAALAPYTVEGYPGQGAPDVLQARIAPLRIWAQEASVLTSNE